MSVLATTADATDLAVRLDALASAVEHGDGRLDAAALADARGVLSRAGERLRLSDHHTVVAIAGGTGSGKSSLFNALAGGDFSPVGVRRPTTATPHAAIWGRDGAGPLLERLAVHRRNTVSVGADSPDRGGLDGLVLVDLPDHDSTEADHRAQVDRLLDLVDLFVWVVDPQKYADAVLHEEYLQPLAPHAAATVVVFNQVDLVDAPQVQQCVQDLRGLLRADGLGAARVVAASARTGAGLDELRSVLTVAVQTRAAAAGRASADVLRVATRLAADVGAAEPPPFGRKERARLAEALEEAAGVPAIADVAAASYRAQAAAATGWPVTRWVGRLRRDPLRRLGLGDGAAGGLTASAALPLRGAVARAQLETAVRHAALTATQGMPPSWTAAARRAMPTDDPRLVAALDEAVTGAPLASVRRRAWWRLLGGLQVVLLVLLVAGLGWLAALFAVDWFRLPQPPTYDVHGVALPTLLAAGGVAGGLLVALVGRLGARSGGRRRARAVRALLRERLADAGSSAILGPLRAEVVSYARVRDELRRAGAPL